MRRRRRSKIGSSATIRTSWSRESERDHGPDSNRSRWRRPSGSTSRSCASRYDATLIVLVLKGRVLYLLQSIARFELPVNVTVSPITCVQVVAVLAPPEKLTAPVGT